MSLFETVEKLPAFSPCITDAGWINHDKYGFSREYSFSVRNTKYVIDCWKNMGYLRCGELNIPFHTFQICGTWPHQYKNELQFFYHGNTCAILPLEEYENA